MILLLCFRGTRNILTVRAGTGWGQVRFEDEGSPVLAASAGLSTRKVGLGFMAQEVLSGWRRPPGYSQTAPRSLIAMLSHRALALVNGPASHVLVRPFVVFAARALGPGPTRLRLVRLAHDLDRRPVALPDGGVHGDQEPAVQPTPRAA